MEEILAYLQLINTESIGPVTFDKLLKRYGTVQDALQAISSKYSIFTQDMALRELEYANNSEISILIKTDERYPKKLRLLEDAPPVLYAKGNLELLNHEATIAIVGTRNATINGRKITSRIAHDLTNMNVLVVSGMAKGIDTAAHKGAMYAQNQKGPTIAVLGTGIDKIYPKENEELYQQIANQGLLVSEFPIGAIAQTGNFPRRNRIVSGLSSGVLVVEATAKSGSLITANAAISQDKAVFAIPGSPTEARASGPNLLIQRGAKLVENANDILKSIKNINSSPQLLPINCKSGDLFLKQLDISTKNVDISTINILKYLTLEGTDIDEIIRLSKLNAATVSMQLLDLEMADKVVRMPGNKIALNAKKVKVKK